MRRLGGACDLYEVAPHDIFDIFTPSTPAPAPAAPAPPPTVEDPGPQAAAEQTRQRAARAAARGSTLLTGGQGVTEQGSVIRQSSLLGG